MSESVARAERLEFRSSASPFYVWSITDGHLSVRLSLDAVERLGQEVIDAFRSVTSRGSEIGGLLLGGVVSDGRPIVVIDDYELVECAYARGPLYRMSDSDRQRFQAAIARRKGAAGPQAVGFFRSNTRKGLVLEAEDVTFIGEALPDLNSIALLVRPFASRASVAGIFLRQNGKFTADASAQEFPFSRPELEKLGPVTNTIPTVPASAASPAPAPPADASPAKTRAQIVPIALHREPTAPAQEGEPISEKAPAPEPAAAKPQAPVKPAPPAKGKQGAAEKPAAPEKQEKTEKQATEEKPAAKAAVPEKPAAAAKTAEKETAQAAPAKPSAPEKPAAEKQEKTETPASAKEAAAPVRGSVLTQAQPAEAQGGNKKMMLIVGAAVAMILIVALFVYPGWLRPGDRSAPPAGNAAGLQLRVERTAGDLLLTWNRDAEAVKTASKGVLQINDGEQHENVEMDLAQLRNGSIVYTPVSPDVSFKLEVTSTNPAKSASESLRVLKTRPSAMGSDTPAAAAQQKTDTPAPAVPAAQTPASETAEAPAVEQPVSKPAPKPFTPHESEPLAARLRSARPTDLPEPPSANGQPALVVQSLPSTPISAPSAPTAVAPPPQSAPAAPASAQTPAPAKVGGRVQAAVLVSRQAPMYPALAKQAHVTGIVKMEAVVAPNGRVSSVKVLSGHPLLRDAAASAVRGWIYRPATLNGEAIESTTQVQVDFTGSR